MQLSYGFTMKLILELPNKTSNILPPIIPGIWGELQSKNRV